MLKATLHHMSEDKQTVGTLAPGPFACSPSYIFHFLTGQQQLGTRPASFAEDACATKAMFCNRLLIWSSGPGDESLQDIIKLLKRKNMSATDTWLQCCRRTSPGDERLRPCALSLPHARGVSANFKAGQALPPVC
mmetsp:Transcript_50216/g.119504  ORF Transcript_50216/g.119504 Transcript_50216/m.119504 type:complete len:135 (+) Transcript_50216:61-465(+)